MFSCDSVSSFNTSTQMAALLVMSARLICRIRSNPKSFESQIADTVKYHLRTAWLFNKSDLKTTVFPNVLFVLSTGTSYIRNRDELDTLPALFQILCRLPQVIFWTYWLLLCFTINNQRQSNSIVEDQMNKPWRPLPAKRLTPTQARGLGMAAYAITFFASLGLSHGKGPALSLVVLSILYNDMGGDRRHWLIRSLLNGAGLASFAAGAFEVAVQDQIPEQLRLWLLTIVMIVATTIHSADMYDQEGDSATNRSTVPLVFGDGPARIWLSVAMLFWSIASPMFWTTSWAGYALTILFGSLVAVRTVLKRSVTDDRKTYKVYNGWLVALYIIPAFGSFATLSY